MREHTLDSDRVDALTDTASSVVRLSKNNPKNRLCSETT